MCIYYIKVVPLIESPAVREKVGNHKAYNIKNPKPYSKKANEKSKKSGILSLKITFYGCKVDEKFTKQPIQF